MTDWIPVHKMLPQFDVPVLTIIEHINPHSDFEIAICMISSKNKENWIYCPPWMASGGYPLSCEKITQRVVRWTFIDIPFDLKLRQLYDNT